MLKALATWQEWAQMCPVWDQGKQDNAIQVTWCPQTETAQEGNQT